MGWGELQSICLEEESVFIHCGVWNEGSAERQVQTLDSQEVGGRGRDGGNVIMVQKWGASKDVNSHVMSHM